MVDVGPTQLELRGIKAQKGMTCHGTNYEQKQDMNPNFLTPILVVLKSFSILSVFLTTARCK
jgi:hypothetical protein